MIALQVALVLLREVLRALLVPLRLCAYLPFRHHWRKVASTVLNDAANHAPRQPDEELAAFFARRRSHRGERPHLFVSAGEASGENHAAKLVRALPVTVRTTAFGGHVLAEAGADVRFQLSEHAVMGVLGVLKQLPLILRAFAAYLRLLRDDPPDLVVLVDYPGLHVVMAKAAKRAGVPVLHYVAPQYWAWGPWRMRRYRRAVDGTLTILPFETAFFRRFRVPAHYIGHPLLDELATSPPASGAVDALRARRTLALLPGSRRAEIHANLPGMLRIAAALRARDPGLRVVLPHKNPRRTELLRSQLRLHGVADWVEHHEGPLGTWLAGAHLVLVKSGTGSLEACLHGVPTIVVYRLRGLLASIGYHSILSVPWIAAANLIVGRGAVPEFCFARERGWDRVQAAAERLWHDAEARNAAIAELAEVRRRLGEPGATQRIAAIVHAFLFPPDHPHAMTSPLLDLRLFLDLLRREGELVEIDTEVDPDLEAAEVHRRVIAAGGPALLFRRVKGSPWPTVTNLFGTQRRVELAFGKRPLELVQQLAAVPHTLLPPTLGKLWQHRSLLGSLLRVGRKRLRRATLLQHEDTPPRLSRLPLLRTWSEDGGPFVTLPLVYTEHPEGLGGNLGMYRIQRFDDDTTGLHVQIGKGGGFHLAAYERLGRPMPVAVHIGGPPALILSAIAPLPENVPEVLLCSLLLGQRLRSTKSVHSPLPLVADCEFCIVGEVRPGERHPEGPFGDHYGYYSLRHDYPLLRAKALLHRQDPILAATVVGKPRQEDFFLGDYLQELLLPLAKVAMPSVRDLWSYGETGYHALAAAVVQERYAREAMQSAFRILGEGQLSLTKFLLLTDRSVDLRDFKATLAHVLARTRFQTDLYVFGSLSMDTLDYAGPEVNKGSKGVLLGLGEPVRTLPSSFGGTLPPEFPRAEVFCPGCLVVQGPAFASDRGAAAALAKCEAVRDWPLVVLVDDAAKAAKSSVNFLWTTFTRFEPAADLHARELSLVHAQPCWTPPIVIDARMKPSYPKELFCDPDTARKVSARWREYFPSAEVAMGDSDRGHLD